jgi:hypothetical protein
MEQKREFMNQEIFNYSLILTPEFECKSSMLILSNLNETVELVVQKIVNI